MSLSYHKRTHNSIKYCLNFLSLIPPNHYLPCPFPLLCVDHPSTHMYQGKCHFLYNLAKLPTFAKLYRVWPNCVSQTPIATLNAISQKTHSTVVSLSQQSPNAYASVRAWLVARAKKGLTLYPQIEPCNTASYHFVPVRMRCTLINVNRSMASCKHGSCSLLTFTQSAYLIYFESPPALPRVLQSAHGTVSRIHRSDLPYGRTLRKKDLRRARRRYPV